MYAQANEKTETSEHGGASEKFSHHTKTFLSATMPQIVTASSLIISLIWTLFYLAFLTVLALQTFLTVKDYISYPINAKITIITTNSLVFPAVTMCNNNVVKKNYIARIPKYRELASLSEIVFQMALPESNRDKKAITAAGFDKCRDSS